MLKYYVVSEIPEKEKRSILANVPDNRDTFQSRWVLYFILVAAAYISVTFAFNYMLADPLAESRLMIHEKVIGETAPKPVQYRIFTYYIAEGIHRITGMALWRIDLIIRFVFTSLTLIFLFKFLRRWFNFTVSAIGPLLLACLLPVTYVDYIHQPHDIPNLFFTILALAVIRDRKEAWLILLIPIAMLNRESFIMVLWAWFFFNYDHLPLKGLLLEFVLFSVLAIVVYLALPYYFGPRDNYVDMLQIRSNLEPVILVKWILRLLAFLGPLTVAAILRFKSKPLFLRRSIGYVIIFMIVNFLFGKYQETRLFLPVLPVMIPLALAAIFPASDPVIQKESV